METIKNYEREKRNRCNDPFGTLKLNRNHCYIFILFLFRSLIWVSPQRSWNLDQSKSEYFRMISERCWSNFP